MEPSLQIKIRGTMQRAVNEKNIVWLSLQGREGWGVCGGWEVSSM